MSTEYVVYCVSASYIDIFDMLIFNCTYQDAVNLYEF